MSTSTKKPTTVSSGGTPVAGIPVGVLIAEAVVPMAVQAINTIVALVNEKHGNAVAKKVVAAVVATKLPPSPVDNVQPTQDDDANIIKGG